MTTTTEQVFWELLKAGLWGTTPHVDKKLNDEEWKEVIEQAKRQTLLGILFDGMLRLPADLQPEEETRLKWFWKVNKIEQANCKLNQILVEFTGKLENEGINSLLLKGQAYASLYPIPLHRQCGDIDLLIGRKNYKRVCIWVKEQGLISSKDEERFHHQSLKYQSIEVELHRVAAKFANPLKHKSFAKWGELNLFTSTKHFIPLTEEKEINIPELGFNVVYVFYHLFTHFFIGGVGLRQLCDWARMLHVYHGEINQTELKHNLSYYGLVHPWQAFGYIIVHLIGLPQKEFPFYKDTNTKSDKILEDILEQGNFGHYAKNKLPYSPNYVIRKCKRFLFHTHRYIDTFKLFPLWGLGAFMLFIYERGIHFFTDYFKRK